MANPSAGSTEDGNASANPPPPPPANGSRIRDGDHGGVRGKLKRRRKKKRIDSPARLKDPVPTDSPARLKDPEPKDPEPTIPAQQSKSSGKSSRVFGTAIDANQLQPLSALVPTEAPTKKRKPTSASRALPNADGSHVADSASASAPNVRSELLEDRHAVAAVAGSTSSSALSSHDSNETGSPSTIPLPKRVRDALPSEIEDPTQFECDLATWERIPIDLRQCLVNKFTDSNDPYGLSLRCYIRVLGKSVDLNGQYPLLLLRRRDLRYGAWKKKSGQLVYEPSQRRQKGTKKIKVLPDSDDDDDLQGCYYTQVLYSNGKSVELTLAHTDIAFLDGTNISDSDIAKLRSKYDIDEMRIDAVKWTRVFMDSPVAIHDGEFDTRCLSIKRNGTWHLISDGSQEEGSGFSYSRYDITASGTVRIQVCGVFMTPVIHNRAGPAHIQSDSAYLVHKDRSRERMSVSIEIRTMNGMYGAARPFNAYKDWTLPSNAPREKLEDLPMEGIRKSDIRIEDVILEISSGWHPGTRQYHQEGLDKLSSKRIGNWRAKAGKEIVASVRGRPGRFLKKEKTKRGIYYDVGDKEAKRIAKKMVDNFVSKE